MDTFDPAHLPRTVFDDRISELQQRVASLEDQLNHAQEQLDWWLKGLELFAAANGAQDETLFEDAQVTVDPESRIVEMVPSTAVLQSPGMKPRLRQAVLRAMLDRPSANGRESRWPAADLIAELDARGWLPNGKSAENMVRHMLRDLVKRGQLVKPGYGTYALAPKTRSEQGEAEDP
jgi:hypothetical protein